MTYAETKGVRTDDAGWPVGVTNAEKETLIESVRKALSWGPMTLDDLYTYCRHNGTLPDGSLLDYLYSCVDRAARAVVGCEQVYMLPNTTTRAHPLVHAYGRAMVTWRSAVRGIEGGDRSLRKAARAARAIIEETMGDMSREQFERASDLYGEIPMDLTEAEKPKARAAQHTA